MWLDKLRSVVFPRRRNRRTLRRLTAECLEPRLLLTLDLQLDYSFDSNNFFADQQRRDVLEAAAGVLESRITDDLDAIVPSADDNWTGEFNNPSTGQPVTISNMTVPADTIIIFVGARDLNGGLGLGGPAGFQSFASQEFNETLETRGEAGVDTSSNADTDFAPWGGTLAIDTQANWNFSLNRPEAGQNDLFTVAVHEMVHILGFGTSDAFANLRSGLTFVGAAATAEHGSAVPLEADQVHVASNTVSFIPETTISQESLLDPQITTGSRKLITQLDWAMLDDIGWDIGPEPSGFDYGDAPDAQPGNATFNYSTRPGENGPSHRIGSDLFIGDVPPDRDQPYLLSGTLQDDNNDNDDEGFHASEALAVVLGTENSISVDVTNGTAGTATLFGWIDFNSDGIFALSEQASVSVPPAVGSQTVELTFAASGDGSGETVEVSFARFRLSTDALASSPTGAAANGEVEDAPILLYPQSRAYDSLPSFTWPATTSAETYEVDVDNLTTGETRVLVESFLPAVEGTNSYRPPQAFKPGAYQWRYRAFDGTTYLPFSSYATFHVFEASGTPFLTDPVASAVDSLPTFAWSPVADAVRYELWVDNDSAVGRKRAIHQTSLTATAFTPTEGLESGEYTAWVRSFDSSGTATAWSAPFAFTVPVSAGVEVEITDPVGSTTNTSPTIGWISSAGSTSDGDPLLYTVRIEDESGSVVDSSVAISESHYVPSVGLSPGDYTVTVTSNAAGASAAGVSQSFRVTEVTGQAEVLAPFGNSENPVPQFSWTAVAGANRYEIWVNDVTNARSRIIGDSGLSGTTYQTLEPLAVGLYRVWVRAFDGANPIGGWSSPVEFRVTEASNVPTIWGLSGSTFNTLPTIAWSNVTGSPSYVVELQRDGEEVLRFESSENDRPQSNFFVPEGPLTPGRYELTVTQFATGGIPLSDSTVFAVESTDGAIEVLSPYAQVANTRPAITWPAVEGATRYFVWLNDVTRDISGLILDGNVTSTAFVPDESLSPGKYRVWVRAYSGTGPVGSWSSPSEFTVTESTEPPVVTSPLSETESTVPTISWTAMTGAVSYELQVDDAETGSSVLTQSGIPSSSFRLPFALNPGTYVVRVRGIDGSGAPSDFGPDNRFRIEPAMFATLTNPITGASVAASDLFFAWSAVEEAQAYELWVSNIDTNTRVIHETALTEISFTPASMLPSARYRVWVRALGPGSDHGVWSIGYEFFVS